MADIADLVAAISGDPAVSAAVSKSKSVSGVLKNLVGGFVEKPNQVKDLAMDFADLDGSVTGVVKSATNLSEIMTGQFWNVAMNTTRGLLQITKKLASENGKNRIAMQNTFGIPIREARLYQQEINKLTHRLHKYGGTNKELTKTSLMFSDSLNVYLSRDFPKHREGFLKNATVLNQYGVSTENVIKVTNKLTTGFEKGIDRTKTLSATLIKFSKETGQSVNKVFSSFAENIDRFNTSVGEGSLEYATKEFTKMQAASQRSGMSISKLTDMVQKYDTMEGMKAGGKLNMLLSQLGSGIDPTKLMGMTQSERAAYMIRQVGAAKGGLSKFGREGQRAIIGDISKALGVQSGEVMKMLNPETAEGVGRQIHRKGRGKLATPDDMVTMDKGAIERVSKETMHRQQVEGLQKASLLYEQFTRRADKAMAERMRGANVERFSTAAVSTVARAADKGGKVMGELVGPTTKVKDEGGFLGVKAETTKVKDEGGFLGVKAETERKEFNSRILEVIKESNKNNQEVAKMLARLDMTLNKKSTMSGIK